MPSHGFLSDFFFKQFETHLWVKAFVNQQKKTKELINFKKIKFKKSFIVNSTSINMLGILYSF